MANRFLNTPPLTPTDGMLSRFCHNQMMCTRERVWCRSKRQPVLKAVFEIIYASDGESTWEIDGPISIGYVSKILLIYILLNLLPSHYWFSKTWKTVMAQMPLPQQYVHIIKLTCYDYLIQNRVTILMFFLTGQRGQLSAALTSLQTGGRFSECILYWYIGTGT